MLACYYSGFGSDKRLVSEEQQMNSSLWTSCDGPEIIIITDMKLIE